MRMKYAFRTLSPKCARGDRPLGEDMLGNKRLECVPEWLTVYVDGWWMVLQSEGRTRDLHVFFGA